MIIEKPIFKAMAAECAAVAQRRVTTAIRCVHVENTAAGLRMRATNLSTSVSLTAEPKERGAEWSALMPADELPRIIDGFYREITVERDCDALVLSEGEYRRRVKIPVYDEADFNGAFPDTSGARDFADFHPTARAQLFGNIEKFCARPPAVTPSYESVHYVSDGASLATEALEGRILSKRSYPIEGPKADALIPQEFARLIQRISGDAKIGFVCKKKPVRRPSGYVEGVDAPLSQFEDAEPHLVVVRAEKGEYVSTLGTGVYPDTRKAMPKNAAAAFKITAYDFRECAAKFLAFPWLILSWGDGLAIKMEAETNADAAKFSFDASETFAGGRIKISTRLLSAALSTYPDDAEISASFEEREGKSKDGTTFRGGVLLLESGKTTQLVMGMGI